MGMGDLKLIGVIGLYQGEDVVCTVNISLSIAIGISLLLMGIGLMKYDDPVPFAPFLFAGTVATEYIQTTLPF